MTREEILAMRPGPELDEAVALNVMGWQIETDPAELKRLSQYVFVDGLVTWYRRPDGGWQCYPAAYSTNIAMAWQVVAKMGDYLFGLSRNRARVRAMFIYYECAGLNYGYSAPTAPEAISKAALLAVL